jgi:hypothetical protein
MSDDFTSASAPSGGITWEEHNGKLLIVEPLSYETGISTVHGEKDAVRANVYVLTGPTTSDDFEDTLVFPGVLVGQLKRQVGSKIVGRLTQGAKKPGQNAPWLLDAATAEDIDKARTWQAGRGLVSASVAAPATGQAEAAPPF